MSRGKNLRPVSNAITPAGGRWHGFVTIGTKVNGKPDRTHRTAVMCASCKVTPDVKCACYRKCEDKVREVENSLAAGTPEPKGIAPGVGQYLAGWLKDCEGRVEYGTVKSYRTVVVHYLAPVSGLRLRQLDEGRIKKLLDDLKRKVSAQAARKTLRTLRVALAEAERKKLVVRNEARFVAMPSLDKTIDEIVPLSRAEALAILPVIMKRRNKARWLLALVHGHRQGECLALAWHRPDDPRMPSDVDLDAGTFTVREKIQRRTWQHGCDDPHACGTRLHKVEPCPQSCNRHTRECPPPCAKDCARHASACPQRHGGGLVKGKPKSRAANRTAVFEAIVLEAFRDHVAQQAAEREAAGSKWSWQHGCKNPADCAEHAVSCPKRVDSGLVFTDLFGRAIDPKRDWDEFQSILAEAELPPARVHDLRHSAATFLLAAGVQKRVVMELMGWSQDMTGLYQHVVEEMKRDAAAAVGAYLWSDPIGSNRPEPDPIADDSATTVLPEPKSNVIQFRRRTA